MAGFRAGRIAIETQDRDGLSRRDIVASREIGLFQIAKKRPHRLRRQRNRIASTHESSLGRGRDRRDPADWDVWKRFVIKPRLIWGHAATRTSAEMTNAAAKIDAENATTPVRELEKRAAELVNPDSGLANDYLNVFNELVMLVEQLPVMPELIDDILAWRPISYKDYFAKSMLPGRQQALDNYERLSPDVRREFEGIVADLDRCATGSVAAIRLALRRKDPDPTPLANLCAKASAAMHGILTRATNLVNHGASKAAENAQLRADRLLAVRIQALRDVKDFANRRRPSQD
jgi:hypothetical protein